MSLKLFAVLLTGLCAFSYPVSSWGESPPNQPVSQGKIATQKKAAIARVWHGRTSTAKAEEYYAYLKEAGIAKIQSIAGNLGVQILRRTSGDVTEFTVTSYWESLDAIRAFAGDEIEKTHHLPRDPEFLLELEPTVKHHEVLLHDWK